MTEMMLARSAEQVIGITMMAVGEEFGPAATNVERRVPNYEAVCHQTHTALMGVTNHDANDFVAHSRKNSLEAWRTSQTRFDPTAGGRERNFRRVIILGNMHD